MCGIGVNSVNSCAVAGVCAGKLVEAHGSFASASCIQCSTKHSAAEVKVS